MSDAQLESLANDIVEEKLDGDALLARLIYALKATYAAGVRDGKRRDGPSNVVDIGGGKKT